MVAFDIIYVSREELVFKTVMRFAHHWRSGASRVHALADAGGGRAVGRANARGVAVDPWDHDQRAVKGRKPSARNGAPGIMRRFDRTIRRVFNLPASEQTKAELRRRLAMIRDHPDGRTIATAVTEREALRLIQSLDEGSIRP